MFGIIGFPDVTFTGRTAVYIADDKHRSSLIELTGVFKEVPGKRLQYIGNAEFKDKDGVMKFIDSDGFCEYDPLKLPEDMDEAKEFE